MPYSGSAEPKASLRPKEVSNRVSVRHLWKAIRRERGQGLAEYGMILLLVAMAVIAAIPLLGNQLSVLLDRISAALSSP
jgi:Flp pilus assembly pilin Flp